MFRGAPKQLQELEEHLLQNADLVFTGGVSLFEAKAPFSSERASVPQRRGRHPLRAGSQFTGDFAEHRACRVRGWDMQE